MVYRDITIQTDLSAPDAKLELYLLDTPEDKLGIKMRPFIVICPGGGYGMTSYREGEPLAMRFLSAGCHVGILRYSVAPARFPAALLELGSVMKLIHKNALDWHVDAGKIIVQGSSAGGHLAGCLGVFWNRSFLLDALDTAPEILRPKGMILSYPVVTTEPAYAHIGSFENLLGDRFCEYQGLVSLEKQVRTDTPPCFLWHTGADGTVPVENSLILAMAFEKHKVPVELHIFPCGEHGLSTADRLVERADGSGTQAQCKRWVDLALGWLEALTSGK